MDLVQVTRVVSDLGLVGLLLVILFGGIKQWWVFGWTYDQARRERDEWKTMALSGTTLAEGGLTLAERAVRRRRA